MTLPPFLPDSLDAEECYRRLAAHLAAAVGDPAHPCHWLNVATVDGTGVAVRTVVLRGWDAAARRVLFHCDLRSPKVGQLRATPEVKVHCYDGRARLQLILSATATVHTADELAAAEWQKLSAKNRAMYLTPHTPGTPLPAEFDDTPVPQDDGVAFARFAAVECVVGAGELLELRPAGNLRVRLAWPGGAVTLTRLAP